jgi:hypothetical protein
MRGMTGWRARRNHDEATRRGKVSHLPWAQLLQRRARKGEDGKDKIELGSRQERISDAITVNSRNRPQWIEYHGPRSRRGGGLVTMSSDECGGEKINFLGKGFLHLGKLSLHSLSSLRARKQTKWITWAWHHNAVSFRNAHYHYSRVRNN